MVKTLIIFVLIIINVSISNAQCTWNGGSGVWSDPTKWSCGHVPLPTDNVIINSGTVTLDINTSVNNFTLNATLAGTGDVTVAGNLSLSNGALGNVGATTVAGTFDWKGGIIGDGNGTAAGSVTVSGATTISTTGIKFLFLKTLNPNAGTTYTGGQIVFGLGGVFNHPVGQTFTANLVADALWTTSTGGGTFNNMGAFDKAGSGKLTMSQIMNNTGIVSGTGTMVFGGAFTNTGLIAPGTSPGVLNLNRSGGLTIFDLEIELEGPAPGIGGYDQINNVTGAINLSSGTLIVTLLNSYLPSVGTSFTIATGTSRTGSFAILDLPVDNSLWSVTYNTTNVVLTVIASLPVELLDFQVNKNNEIVMLDWVTASEQNNRGFGIERSTDGTRFEEIGYVFGNGNSLVNQYYYFEDINLPQSSLLFYRLRQEDEDGTHTHSSIRSIKNPIAKSSVQVWPNPFTDAITISLSQDKEVILKISLLDFQGRFIREVSNVESTPGSIQTIPISDWGEGSGCYLLRVEYAEMIEQIKIVKR